MAKPDLFDEIITCLKMEAEREKVTNISPEVLQEFYTDSNSELPVQPAAQPSPQAAPINPGPAPVNTGELSNMDIDTLQQTTMACVKCPLHTGRTNVVFSDGDPHADLMFIGEGPGKDEDAQGVPFVGRAGQLLTKMINAMQFERSEVYIANIVKCRPPNNRNPEPEEADACLPFLIRQIELVRPKVIVLLGAVPLKFILGKTGITKIHGVWHEFMGVKVMPSLHPAYLLRNPPAKRDAWDDLKKVMAELGKTP